MPAAPAPTITTVSRSGGGQQPGPTASPAAPLAIPPNTARRVSADACRIVAICPFRLGTMTAQIQRPTAFAALDLMQFTIGVQTYAAWAIWPPGSSVIH